MINSMPEWFLLLVGTCPFTTVESPRSMQPYGKPQAYSMSDTWECFQLKALRRLSSLTWSQQPTLHGWELAALHTPTFWTQPATHLTTLLSIDFKLSVIWSL